MIVAALDHGNSNRLSSTGNTTLSNGRPLSAQTEAQWGLLVERQPVGKLFIDKQALVGELNHRSGLEGRGLGFWFSPGECHHPLC